MILQPSQMLGIVRPVAEHPATGFDGPSTYRRTGAAIHNCRRSPAQACRAYGGCAWETVRSAGVLYARSVNLRTAATLIRLTANRGSSSHTGVTPMTDKVLSLCLACRPGNVLNEFFRPLANPRAAARLGGTQ